VANVAFVNLFAKLLGITFRSFKSSRGSIIEHEVFQLLGSIYVFLFANVDEAEGLRIKAAASDAYQKLSKLLIFNINKESIIQKGFRRLFGNQLTKPTDSSKNIILLTLGVITLSQQVLPFFSEILMFSSHRYWISICQISMSKIGKKSCACQTSATMTPKIY
jgi:hypothetical protein